MKRPAKHHGTISGWAREDIHHYGGYLFRPITVWWKTSLVKVMLRVVRNWSGVIESPITQKPIVNKESIEMEEYYISYKLRG